MVNQRTDSPGSRDTAHTFEAKKIYHMGEDSDKQAKWQWDYKQERIWEIRDGAMLLLGKGRR